MEKYLKAVSEMYSQFKKEAHPLERYVGRLVNYYGEKFEVVGYSVNELADEPLLIIDVPGWWGWSYLEPHDVVFKECEGYFYVGLNYLTD